MKTGLTKKQKVTELFYNAKDPMAEIYTHDTKLKRRLTEYAEKHPRLCQLTEDDEQGDDEDCAEVVECEPSDVAPEQSEWGEDYGRREQLQRKEHRGAGTTSQQRYIDREGEAEEDVRHGESYVVA